MADISLLKTAAASVPTPTTGRISIFGDTATGAALYKDDTGAVHGLVDFTGGALTSALNEVKAVDLASATTTDIGAVVGNYVHVTGTTTITGLGTVQAGTRRIVEFDASLTLTYHATNLILPTKKNIQTAAGDVAYFVSEGSGAWRCVGYLRASGQPMSSAVTAISSSAGVLDIDCSKGDYFTVTLTENITSITFSNLPPAGAARTIMLEITQHASAAKTVAWPSSFKWAGASAGVVSTSLSAIDVLALTTFNQGTAWRATLAKAFA